MKKYFMIILCGWIIPGQAQNVGIGTTTPAELLHVTQTADGNKNVIYGFAGQTPGLLDYQNTGVTGFGQGNGVANSFGYGFGIKGIGSVNGYGAVGVFASIASGIPSVVLGNRYYALYADAGTASINHYAGIFLNGNVGIGTVVPSEKLDVSGNIQASGTVEGTAHTFPTPKTYYYSLSGSDVTAKTSNDLIDKENVTGGGVYLFGGTGSMTAPVHLPHGAVVTKMTVYFRDESPINFQVILRRNSSTTAMASIASSTATGEGSLFDNTISNGTIDNNLYAYTIDINPVGGPWPDVNIILRRIVFDYTVSSL